MKALLILAVLLLVSCGIPQADMARLMAQEGIHPWADTGYALWGCGENDTFHEGFTGIKNGVQVSGVICGGMLKNYTIRYK